VPASLTGRRRAGTLPLGLAAAVAVAVLTLVPLGFVVVASASAEPAAALALLFRARVGELLVNTVGLVLATTTACAVVGTTAAWVVVRTTVPGRPVWIGLLAAPLAVPAFVNSYAWVSMTSAVEGFAGAVLVTTLSYFPFVALPVAATLRGLDPVHEETARALGLGPVAAVRRAVLPALRPAVLGGSLLVGLHLLAEFGALQMLRFPTFTTAIYDAYESTFAGPAATLLAAVLVLLCLVLLAGELRLAGRLRLARVGAGAARPRPPRPAGRATPLALLGLATLVVLALGVPLAALGRWLAEGSSTAFPVAELGLATLTSLGLAAAGAAVTTVLALPIAWVAVRHPGRIGRLVERSSWVGSSLPGIVVALALVTVTVRALPVIYQTTALLLVGYAILFLPRAMVAIRAALAQVPPELDDVARSLGVRPAGVMARVTLPLVARGVGAGSALVFLAVVTELTATLLLAPIGTDTLATEFWGRADAVAYGAAAPYAALMVLISAPAAWLLTRRGVPGGPA